MELSIGLHDAVLGRQHGQHFLKIKILTRERQPQSGTQARIQVYAQMDRCTREQCKPQRGGRAHQQDQITGDVTKRTKPAQAVRSVQTHDTKHTRTQSVPASTPPPQGGMQEERKEGRKKDERKQNSS